MFWIFRGKKLNTTVLSLMAIFHLVTNRKFLRNLHISISPIGIIYFYSKPVLLIHIETVCQLIAKYTNCDEGASPKQIRPGSCCQIQSFTTRCPLIPSGLCDMCSSISCKFYLVIICLFQIFCFNKTYHAETFNCHIGDEDNGWWISLMILNTISRTAMNIFDANTNIFDYPPVNTIF